MEKSQFDEKFHTKQTALFIHKLHHQFLEFHSTSKLILAIVSVKAGPPVISDIRKLFSFPDMNGQNWFKNGSKFGSYEW